MTSGHQQCTENRRFLTEFTVPAATVQVPQPLLPLLLRTRRCR